MGVWPGRLAVVLQLLVLAGCQRPAPPPAGAVGGGGCERDLETMQGEFMEQCCGKGCDAAGIPPMCNTNCARLWTPYLRRCSLFIQVRPLRARSHSCWPVPQLSRSCCWSPTCQIYATHLQQPAVRVHARLSMVISLGLLFKKHGFRFLVFSAVLSSTSRLRPTMRDRNIWQPWPAMSALDFP